MCQELVYNYLPLNTKKLKKFKASMYQELVYNNVP